MDTDAVLPPQTIDRLHRRARFLAWATVGYNLLEAAASLVAAWYASSIALAGFGLDSVVESLSGLVVVWRLAGNTRNNIEESERRERIALRLIGATFFIFAAYVMYESVMKLLAVEHPEPSVPGIIIALASIIVMPVLYTLKFRTGTELGSRSIIADARETLACIYLSVSLLVGLAMNALFGLWWADPVTGLIVVVFLVREGRETLAGSDD